MSYEVWGNEVKEAFAEAKPCANAPGCKKIGEAMCVFYKASNKITAEEGQGLITFYDAPNGPCPNQDQLFCQERE